MAKVVFKKLKYIPMDIDDKDFYMVRKNLNTFSVLLLILAISTAEIEVINLLGLKIDLNGERFYIALLVLYLYLTWRFLTKLPLKSGFWNEFTQYYMQSYGGEKMLSTYERFKEEMITDPPEPKWVLEKKNARLVQVHGARLAGNSIRQLRIIATFYIHKDGTGSVVGKNVSAHHDIIVPRVTFLRKLLFFCFKFDKFGDYLFPIIPILINTVLFFTNTKWQGGFKNLFGC